jgi:hypothetical protein
VLLVDPVARVRDDHPSDVGDVLAEVGCFEAAQAGRRADGQHRPSELGVPGSGGGGIAEPGPGRSGAVASERTIVGPLRAMRYFTEDSKMSEIAGGLNEQAAVQVGRVRR